MNTTEPHIEQQAIKVVSGKSPPASSCPPGVETYINHLLEQDFDAIAGDFKAYHSLWHSVLNEDSRGSKLSNQISESHHGVANEPKPTRIANNTFSSPDIN